ncbi:unnamed protein product [Schistosoma rodhaini]|uniref:Transcription factor CBF/NF-Y/archaeal histone domain-containing protein n=2 Tax=Schistosoma TaxID=6181 RepID=A0AA85EWI7_9TREM|nr:unnamed protein product [Schistosoma rodhaini]CAH8483867.1 unnamed protein product [Schistosoma rodhaini]
MEHSTDSQGEESSYQEPSYYEGLDGSLQDHDVDYQAGDIEQRSPLREQDRFLPIANVAKIMKRAVPGNGKIAKDAKECVQECVSEFISFITSEAADKCQTEKRKTINGEDILCAMNTLGFDNYIEPLRAFLVKFREISKLESSFIDESSVPTTMSTVPPAVGSAVILSPTLLSTGPSGLTNIPSRSLAGRQYAVVNGSNDIQNNNVHSVSTPDIKVANAGMTTLGTPVSSSLGTTIILPISTPLAFVSGPQTSVSLADQSTDSVS